MCGGGFLELTRDELHTLLGRNAVTGSFADEDRKATLLVEVEAAAAGV